MIHQGIAPKVKTEHSRVAKEQKVYCVKHWSVFIRLKSSCSMSAICATDIRMNFSSSRRRCIPSNEMEGT